MLSSWKVLNSVASRHGKLEGVFDESYEKFKMVKEGAIPLISLEDNMHRMHMRMSREKQPSPIAIERIINEANFQDKYVLEKLAEKALAVCRILKRGNPIGTGFLVANDVIITNHHVIEKPEDANELLAEFDYELDVNRVPKKSSCFKMNTGKFWLTSTLEKSDDPHSGLDFTLIGVETSGTNGEVLNLFSPVHLDGNQGKIIKGESCVIIQHPNGLPKKVVLKDIGFFSETNTRIVYESDTLPGSSGAMVVGLGTCEIIALHHSGLPRTDDKNRILTRSGEIAQPGTPDEEIDWLGNEGIKISKIIEALENAPLSSQMEGRRAQLLRKSKTVAAQLTTASKEIEKPVPVTASRLVASTQSPSQKSVNMTSKTTPLPSTRTEFLLTCINNAEIIQRIEAVLSNRYQETVRLSLAMPSLAEEGAIELFSLSVSITGNSNEEASNMIKIPGVLNAEADTPLRLNADTTFMTGDKRRVTTESTGPFVDDGLGTWDEDIFIKDYSGSRYVDINDLQRCRKWNWQATGFDNFLNTPGIPSPREEGIRIVQFDTGFTNHSKVAGGFDVDQDFNFIISTGDATDPQTIGLGKQPGHGTRTGSLLVGAADLPIEHNGNVGLLTADGLKLVPYRIAETVILINRQKQLASALDMAISQGFDIITMSMGLPPTIATAKMAKKAYEKGVIWCCAAGNEVKAVVAPAVFPGTIAVAASNPLDRIWKGSSRGTTVDITAPGEDVYVPIWNKNRQEDFAYGNGTSYATPHIAAAAAYWLAKYRLDLNKPEYAGWKRVEAFRTALKHSARKPDNFPNDVGAGILNMDALMKEKPSPAHQLKHAYTGWNENAFFASVQGYGELLKTYWNGLHGWITGKNKRSQESISTETITLSPTSKQLEDSLFSSRSQYESSDADTADEILNRYQRIQSFVEQAAK